MQHEKCGRCSLRAQGGACIGSGEAPPTGCGGAGSGGQAVHVTV